MNVKRILHPLVTVACIVLGAGAASAVVSTAVSPHGSGTVYTSFFLTDMDGDSVSDVVAGTRNYTVEVWAYDPAGQTLDKTLTAAGFPYDVHDAAVADLDGDGDKDVVAAVRGYGLYMARNNGSGFDAPVNLAWGYGNQVEVADFDLDGDIDILFCTGFWGGGVRILYNDSGGAFTEGAAPGEGKVPGSSSVGMNIRDLNGDGRPDLMGVLSGPYGTGWTAIYLNLPGPNGSVLWTDIGPPDVSSTPLGSVHHSSADFDEDGIPDLVVASGAAGYDSIETVSGKQVAGAWIWTQSVVQTGNVVMSVQAHDVNHDGHVDLVAANPSVSGLDIYYGDGHGAFSVLPETLSLPTPVGGTWLSVMGGDVDEDGDVDFVADRRASPDYGFYFIRNDSQPINHPPVVSCLDVVVSADEACVAAASIDGGASDPDGDALTVTLDPPGPYGLGTTVVELTASDGADTASCSGSVTVVDTTPPLITAAAVTPGTLWPPNHQMVPISWVVQASDNCDPTVATSLLAAVSSEPDDMPGGSDGNTTGDIQLTGPTGPALRAERSGTGPGRVYTIILDAQDDMNNQTTVTRTVLVPKHP